VSKITAKDIEKVLAQKHQRDAFYRQVKNGPTHAPLPEGLLIMDAVVISKSWSNLLITAYEIKISRSDFLSDNKLHLYKQYCHRLDVVCPAGLIKQNEVDDDTGLIWINPKTKQGWVVKKKGRIRKLDRLPSEMFLYLIMNKADDDHALYSNSRMAAEEYLADKIDSHSLGRRLGKKIGHELQRLNDRVRNMQFEHEHDKRFVEAGEKFLREAGHGVSYWEFNHLLQEIKGSSGFQTDKIEKKVNVIIAKAKEVLSEIREQDAEATKNGN